MAYKKVSGIYKITSPSGKIYIGKSKNLSQRLNNYKNSEKNNKTSSQIRLYNSIQKYGWENHTFQIIEECEISELYCRERYWQDFYDVIGENGLNCILQKCEEHPAQISEITRQKMSDSMKGENNPMYGKDWRENKSEEELKQHSINISNAMKGRIKSDETRKKLSENNARIWKGVTGESHPSYGNKLSQEQKDSIRDFMLSDKNPHRGKKRSPESVQRTIDGLVKEVSNYHTLEKLPSAKVLANRLGMNVGTLTAQLNGNNYNTTDWVYTEDLDKPINRKPIKEFFTEEEKELIKNCTISELIKTDKLLYRRYYRHNPDNIIFNNHKKWTEDTLKNVISKYTTLSEIQKYDQSAYQTALKKYPHLLDTLIKNKIIWSEDMVMEEIKKYKNWSDIYKNNSKLKSIIQKRFSYMIEDLKNKGKKD